jgi:hypothetical protein
MPQNERVLLAVPVRKIMARLARQIAAEGADAVPVASVAEARTVEGTFDRGMFCFDLLDGSGIVLAAELVLEGRIDRVEFLHPDEERSAHERPSGVRSASAAVDVDEQARNVA